MKNDNTQVEADWTGVDKRGWFVGPHGVPSNWHFRITPSDKCPSGVVLFFGADGYVELNGKFNAELTNERRMVMGLCELDAGSVSEVPKP